MAPSSCLVEPRLRTNPAAAAVWNTCLAKASSSYCHIMNTDLEAYCSSFHGERRVIDRLQISAAMLNRRLLEPAAAYILNQGIQTFGLSCYAQSDVMDIRIIYPYTASSTYTYHLHLSLKSPKSPQWPLTEFLTFRPTLKKNTSYTLLIK
jgi:hypothetical protein